MVSVGAIIPQIGVRDYIGDGTTVNPITLHLYPGKDNVSLYNEQRTVGLFFNIT